MRGTPSRGTVASRSRAPDLVWFLSYGEGAGLHKNGVAIGHAKSNARGGKLGEVMALDPSKMVWE